MTKYYKKPKDADAYQYDGAIASAPDWVQTAIADGRIVVNGSAVALVHGTTSIAVNLTDWIVLEDGGLLAISDAVFQAEYGKDTRADAGGTA